MSRYSHSTFGTQGPRCWLRVLLTPEEPEELTDAYQRRFSAGLSSWNAGPPHLPPGAAPLGGRGGEGGGGGGSSDGSGDGRRQPRGPAGERSPPQEVAAGEREARRSRSSPLPTGAQRSEPHGPEQWDISADTGRRLIACDLAPEAGPRWPFPCAWARPCTKSPSLVPSIPFLVAVAGAVCSRVVQQTDGCALDRQISGTAAVACSAQTTIAWQM